MKKNFVLDTNVLLHDAQAITGFADNNVCIPIYVIEEIDQFKKDLSELGRNAREVSRTLDRFRSLGNLANGVDIPTGGTLRVVMTSRRLPPEMSLSHQVDSSIMAVALDLKEREPNTPVIFVTKDTNLRIRADAIGITAVDYDKGGITLQELYPGATELLVSTEQVDAIFSDTPVRLLDVDALRGHSQEFFPNEYILLRDSGRPTRTALGRICGEKTKIEPIRSFRDPIWGIKPRNKEQHYALDALLRDEIQLVTLTGKAGTGKTLLALAAGLHKATDETQFRRVLVSRPIFPLGRDIGYLPGSVEDKLKPWMQPIHDNVEFLLSLAGNGKRQPKSYKHLHEAGLLEVEPLTYIRGRSIPQQYMIVDEAQNLTPHEVKTILTRAGENTKMVFTGDPYQIDHPYVDSINNGLTYLAQRFKSEKIAAHVNLAKGERSPLAELAANLL